MARQTVQGRVTGESVDDLTAWLSQLSGCPSVDRVHVAHCCGDGEASWFYVEADPRGGTARRRCIACGSAVSVLDSDRHWDFPPTWSCPECRQSIAEVAYGLHLDGDGVGWVAMGARCVECGTLGGLTDLLVPGTPVEQVLGAL